MLESAVSSRELTNDLSQSAVDIQHGDGGQVDLSGSRGGLLTNTNQQLYHQQFYP